MQTKQISNPENRQSGNALIYVLIAIALFAALSFTLGRQTDTSEAGVVDEERTELYAAQLIDYSAQVKSAVDQMLFSGAYPEELTFFLPGDTDYDGEATYRDIYKIYHPSGGGLSEKTLSSDVQDNSSTNEPNPEPGWYMGRFNNIEWTKTSGVDGTDVVLVAYKITKPVCAAINEKITGSEAIPKLTGNVRDYFIHDTDTTPSHVSSNAEGHTGSNAEFTKTVCADCEGMPSLCVTNNNEDVYAYYSLIAER